MKLNDVRKSLKTEFENNNIDSIDADFIIAEVLNVSHTELNLIDEISNSQFQSIQDFAKERLQGKPIDKIFKKKYFYGLEFVVDENVLTPRSDSEILVEKALVPWQTAINSVTINPARLINVDDRKGTIQTGKDADLVVLNDDYSVEMTYTKGKKAF